MSSTSDLQGWILVGISSCACVLGGMSLQSCCQVMNDRGRERRFWSFHLASIVFIDKLWSKTHESILENSSFLAGSMSLASGVLLFSSLSILLPASQKKLDSTTLSFVCFFGGALFTAILSKVIHWCTPDAVHACGGPPSPLDNNHADEERASPTSSHDSGRGSSQDGGNEEDYSEEYCVLNHHSKHRYQNSYGAVPFREAHFRIHPSIQPQQEHHQHHHRHPSRHHHGQERGDHQADDKDTRDWLRIGIQTAIAIGVHKFPGKYRPSRISLLITRTHDPFKVCMH